MKPHPCLKSALLPDEKSRVTDHAVTYLDSMGEKEALIQAAKDIVASNLTYSDGIKADILQQYSEGKPFKATHTVNDDGTLVPVSQNKDGMFASADKTEYDSNYEFTPIGESNERSRNGNAGKGTLEGVLAGTIQQDGKSGRAAKGSGSSSGTDTTGNRSPAGSATHSTGSVGNVEAVVHSDKTVGNLGLEPVDNDFVITNDSLGEATKGQRIAANMAAIRLFKKISAEGRHATQAEKEVLSNFTGWGAIKNVFDPTSKSKQEIDALAELKSILTPNELYWAKNGALAQHFTSPEVIGSMYAVLEHFGFKGGNLLEPTYGVGNFIGSIPQSLKASSKWYGSEIDPVAGGIAKLLYPEATLMSGTGFQEAEFPNNKFDVVIGNPPFGDERITDKNPRRNAISGFKIHNYITAKGAMHLQPGGVLAFVVTNRFLDTRDAEARDYLAANFDLLAAIRLPNTAFKKNAGTEVTTDIVFFQKRLPGQVAGNTDWLDTQGSLVTKDGETIRLNKYFAENPGMMLGTPSMAGTMYGTGEQFTLNPHEGKTIAGQIKQLLKHQLSGLKGVMDSNKVKEVDADAHAMVMNRDDVQLGGYIMEGSDIFKRRDDDTNGNSVFEKLTPEAQWTTSTKLGETRLSRIRGMLELRSLGYKLINAERADSKFIEQLRKSLNTKYDAFVKEHGFISSNANTSLMDGDVKIESGLETNYRKAITATKASKSGFAASKDSADKADLLLRRVFWPYKEILSAANPLDGYSISLSEKGKLDIPYIAQLTGRSEDSITDELSAGDTPLIYQDPVTKDWVQADEYLSGNVKAKYREAMSERGFEKNAEHLKAVFPADLKQDDIFVDMGQTWVPPNVYSQFLAEVGVTGSKITINRALGTVTAETRNAEDVTALSTTFKNSDYSITAMFNMVANKKPVVAYDRDSEGNKVTNHPRTKELAVIAKRLNSTFKDWLFSDLMRAKDLTDLYNETQNTTIERKHDGNFLVTYGANPSVQLRDTQKDAAWRMIQTPAILLDHVVGAGKTMTLITGIMERKRLGISKKAMLVVPNHLVGQWGKDFIELYPGARILAATEKDFAKANRRKLMARIATGDYDAVIVGHSQFKFIAMSVENQSEFMQKDVEYLQKALEGVEDKKTVRTIQNKIAKRREKIAALNSAPKDDVADFQQMGIDYLAVDESHAFKNLEYATGMQSLPGMGNQKGSQQAFDMYMKIRSLLDGEGGVAFATGTPVSNSLVEMYAIMRYLNAKGLSDRAIESFDAWAKNYASIDSVIEYTGTGKLKERSIMGSFNNAPEMMQIYREFADVVTMNDLKRKYSEQVAASNAKAGENQSTAFPVPNIKRGGRQLHTAEPSDNQLTYIDYLIERALNVEQDMKSRSTFNPSKDNLLWIYNDAKKAAMDLRMVDPSAPDNPNSKINQAIAEIFRIYTDSSADKGTQLVFADMSTPSKTAQKDATKAINSILTRFKLTDNPIVNSISGYEHKWVYLRDLIAERIESGAIAENDLEATTAFMSDIEDNAGVFTTADTGFSAYDDIKTKLVAMGIPEHEIQFIHSYNSTPDKIDLFNLVNKGKVRILLGSTAKLGAGTNVQERLVALHHIDASQHNRPSDIEQREGRIIRQGNKLYMRDPDGFQVEIHAYSTARTFDAVAWQTLAKKAKMLDSFRAGARTVEEDTSDAASYLEFMAETTGNPIFREKVKLESELNELESDQRRIAVQTASAKRTIENEKDAIKELEYRRENYNKLAGLVGNNPAFTLNGKEYADDYDAIYSGENEVYLKDKAKYAEEMAVYTAKREEYDAGEVGNRGTAPAKPADPKLYAALLDRMQEKSEGARFRAALYDGIEALGKGTILNFKFGDLALEATKTVEKTRTVYEISDYKGVINRDGTNLRALIADITNSFDVDGYKRKASHIDANLQYLKESVKDAHTFLDNNSFNASEELAAKQARYKYVRNEVAAVEDVESERRQTAPNKYIESDTNRFPSGTARPTPAKYDPSIVEGIFNPEPIVGKESTPSSWKTDRLNERFDYKFSKSYTVGLYSALGRALEGAPARVFESTSNIKAWIAKQAGVKADEIYWSGINDWLDMQKGKVSRDDVLKFVNENGVQVKDVVLGGDIVDMLTASERARYEILNGQARRSPPTGRGWTQEQFDEYDDLLLKRRARVSAKHNTEQLTLPGGTDYRELVVTIPTTESFNEGDTTHFGDVGKGKQVAWIRHNTRTDSEGGKSLFLEEVQSQRSQQGRRSGFKLSGMSEAAARSALQKFVADMEAKYNTTGWGIKAHLTDEESAQLSPLENAVVDAAFDGSVPPAPFVTDSNNKATNAYISLLLKKAIVEAVANGHDSISWTTGDQQADRYDLSKHIANIDYAPALDGDYTHTGNFDVNVYDKDGFRVKALYGATPEQIAELAGKAVADKIVSGEGDVVYHVSGEEGRPALKMRSLSGLNLKTGGAWTKAMYGDERGMNAQGKPSLIMQAANEIARKFGGEVGSVDLKGIGAQPALIITPAMREKVLTEGLPLFSQKKKTTGSTIAEVTAMLPGRVRKLLDSGKLVIVKSGPELNRRLKSHHVFGAEAMYDPNTDTVYLVADHITAENITPILAHELLHRAIETNAEVQGVLKRFQDSIARSFKHAEAGRGSAVEREAYRRVIESGTDSADKLEEYQAYLVTGYNETAGMIRKAIDDFVAAIRMFLVKHGLNVKSLTPADLNNLARKGVEQGAQTESSGTVKASVASDLQDQLTDKIKNVILNAKEPSVKSFNLWHRTVGTQYHKALINPAFGKVFNASMQLEKDAARMANDDADLAPSLLPKTDSAGAAFREVKTGYRRAKDANRVGEAIFESTIRDSIMTDTELQRAGYTDAQRTMYREFYAAANQSLDGLTKSVMLRSAKALKLVPADEKLNLVDTARWYENQSGDPSFRAIADKVQTLKKQAYAPLMRFGNYTVSVEDNATGKNEFFGMNDSEAEAKEMARAMAELYPNATVMRGIMSEKSWELFKGSDPEALKEQARLMGIDQDIAFQTYLATAINNRSAMKRMIHRKKVPGYVKDTQRVLAQFLTSNAKSAATNRNIGDIVSAITAIDKRHGDVVDEAVALYNYTQNPTEKGAAIRALLFTWYLGGSVASAAVNLTQTLTTTTPYLHQFGETKQVGRILMSAMEQALRPQSSFTGALKAALHRAEEEGVTAPHELHMLYGQAMRTGLLKSQVLRPLGTAWGLFFSLAEAYNRRVAFIAAYNLAVETKRADPFTFASKAVEETQFVYNKSARANISRSTVGSMVMTFKTFTTNYLEFIVRLPPKERVIALGILIMLAGLSGLPFADDADDIIDTVGQSLGYNTNSKEWKENVLTDMVGKTYAQYALYGASHGSPIDFSQRVGLGNLVPGTGLLKRSEPNKTRDIAEFVGPVGGMFNKAMDSAAAMQSRQGAIQKAGVGLKAILPLALTNLAQGVDMASTGQYHDYRGKNVTSVDMVDAVMKSIGFQPRSVAETRRPERFLTQDITMAKTVESDIVELWADGVNENDSDKISEARSMLSDWNTKNPETPIRIKPKQVQTRVRAMKLTSRQRLMKTAPRELRRHVAEELNDE